MEYIILAVIVLGIVAANQLFKIYEISRELRPNEPEVITEADSKFNARLGVVFVIGFFAFVIWSVVKWKHLLLPEPASKHGVEIDNLMDVTLIIITIPFIICNVLLFYFLNKYYFRKDRKADFFAHSNKLEAVWTIVPAVVLATLIIYGLAVWNGYRLY
jgi:cytochrome c oxidase subunit II